MCFRPAEADAGVKPTRCSNCEKMVFPVEGILPSKCPFCKEPLEVAAAPAPGAPAAPAPGAPAPAAPGAPVPPGVPKPPSA